MKKLQSHHEGTHTRKREIIEAALSCFNDLGYNETSISDILKKAGASTGSLYHHFGSKEQLAGEVYLEGIRDYQEGFIAVLERESDAQRGISAVIEYHVKWVEQNREWAQYLFRMRNLEFMAQKEGEFAKLNEEIFGRIAVWFRKQISAGAICRMSPDLYPAILMGPCLEFSRQYLNGHTSIGIDVAVKELATTAWRALRNEKSN